MKHKQPAAFLPACILAVLMPMQIVHADLTSDSDEVFDWAEKKYPQWFPHRAATERFEPWLYRFYPPTGTYAGVRDDAEVFVMGGPFGGEPQPVGRLENLLTQVRSDQNQGQVAGCNTQNAIPGFSYNQQGDTVTVTTNGQCIKVPDNYNVCEAPPTQQVTGISVLSSNQIDSFEMGGINLTIPGMPNPFDTVAQMMTQSKSCVINAPEGYQNQRVNMDICIDATDQMLSSGVQAIPGVMEIVPPITMRYTGNSVNQVVADCFATDATVVTNAVTGEAWVRQGDNFVQVQ